jgi:hypothetical protein
MTMRARGVSGSSHLPSRDASTGCSGASARWEPVACEVGYGSLVVDQFRQAGDGDELVFLEGQAAARVLVTCEIAVSLVQGMEPRVLLGCYIPFLGDI